MRTIGSSLIAGGMLAAGAMAQERVKPAGWPAKPPVAAVRPVTETLHGATLVDPYRYMETAGDAETLGWIRAQGGYTRSVLDAIPARAAYADKLAAASGAFGPIFDYREAGGRTFYTERPAGGDVFDLMVREGDNARKLVDIAGLNARTGKPHAINYFTTSDDGKLVAVGISAGGSENANLTVVDVASGRTVAGPIPNARFANPSFGPDGKLAFSMSQPPAPNRPATATFLNRRSMIWDMKGAPVEVIGALVATSPIKLKAEEFPFVGFERGSRHASLIIAEGVRNEADFYLADAAAAARGQARWRRIAERDADQATNGVVVGERVYLLTHKDAPTFKVTRLDAATGTAATATTVLPARPGQVYELIAGARDAAYVGGLKGVYGTLTRIPHAGGAPEEVPLPIKGVIASLWADPTRDGLVIQLAGWTAPLTLYRYDPASRRFTELYSGARPAVDPARYAVHDLLAPAKDGVAVPFSVVAPAGPRRPRPMLIGAYGSYGISQLPAFSPWRLAMLDAGAATATCHVRGGGELGEAWRLGGKDANKPNTWRDLIACAEYAIAQGWTTRDQLSIIGGSAGGIPMGRAMIERPDLFAGVISAVPMASAIRAEFQQNGPVNIVEFGTIKDPQGFRNLLAMDAYFTLEAGKAYPPVMFTTGLNDPRVDSWQPAKAAARMQALGGANPVLLRVEGEGGHGIGATRKQGDELQADIAAFVFWRAGLRGWQPAAR